MNNVIDHDRLFKPEIINYLEPNQITFLDKEVFTDVTEGEKYESDLVAQVQFRGQSSFFLIHLEAQSSSQPEFNRRMFTYFARLHQKFALPVYPIVIFSYDRPQKEAIRQYKIEFPDLKVLEFNYQVVQLNRLNWRDFLNQDNPVAAALMAKMKIADRDRAKVKAQCLRLLVTLRLDAARMQLISGFVDTYLNLNSSEEIEFQQEISTFIQPEQEGVMQITTSWMRRGLEQGLEQGLERGLERGLARERNLIVRLIKRKLGDIDVDIESRIMTLNIDDLERAGEALFDFSTVEDLTNWLNALDA
ncbi:MAG: DUF4351 domain-containing protein [Microcystis aeruginosa G13-03]|nr:DUF4351 domain-containing protein [Microcystis aeruginosa G13-03]